MGAGHLGEVIEAASASFVAETPPARLHEPPPFGSLVRVAGASPGQRVYGVVSGATTGSSDPGRRPTAYGLEPEALRAQQPQIFELLRTTFTAAVVGYGEGADCYLVLPPAPPAVHAFVHECTAEEIIRLTDKEGFARVLLAGASPVADELVAACLRLAYLARGKDYPFLVRGGRELAAALSDDHRRLAGILDRITPYLK